VPVLMKKPPTRFVLIAFLVLLCVACRGSDRSTSAPSSYRLLAGLNDVRDPTIAILQFMPASLSVVKGSTLTWTWSGAEPHSVTFLPPGQQPPPPQQAEAFAAPTIPADGLFDGTTLANSGLQPTRSALPKPFSLKFTSEGTYVYHCVIHPTMIGTVHVVASGDFGDSAKTVSDRRDRELTSWLEEGRAAKRRLIDTGPRSSTVGGVTTWIVQMGAATVHTAVRAFAPIPVRIKPGDRVTFVNHSDTAHTASFAQPSSLLPSDPDNARAAVPGPSPQTLRKTGYFSTGWVPGKQPNGMSLSLARRSYTFIVPSAGSYPFVCLIHRASRMEGTIEAA
jgi:plastocyanin